MKPAAALIFEIGMTRGPPPFSLRQPTVGAALAAGEVGGSGERTGQSGALARAFESTIRKRSRLAARG
ncbi:hypothetical protein, partial [Micromonospora noduli]|uniref:hypothetical protein n=1 Tax=Micromonospora noduli TaxID=709876 RepID=UPI001C65B377